jgi:hypothetical protein
MNDMESNRRSLLLAAPLLFATLAAGDKSDKIGSIGDIKLAPPPKTGPDPAETFVQPYDQIGFQPWGNLPPHSGEMAKLYGDFDKPGPYLVMMKWNPGWYSARGSSTAGTTSSPRTRSRSVRAVTSGGRPVPRTTMASRQTNPTRR